MVRAVSCGVMLVLATNALAGDGAACRKARRTGTIDGWTAYVLAHPEGRCLDQAMGQLLMLGAGQMISGMIGDPTQFALSMAQLGHMDPAALSALGSMFGGSGLSGLGDPGLGLGALDGLGALGGLDALGAGEGYGIGYGSLETGSSIDASFVVDRVDGTWSDADFWSVLSDTRPALQSCWAALGRSRTAVSYLATFEVKAGAVAVSSLEPTYVQGEGSHEDIDGCLRQSLEAAAFPATVSGTYSYRVDLY